MDRELFVKNFSDYEKEFKPNNELRDLIIAALEKDDVQAIESLRSECNPGAIKFGRFPFLSVAYLLSAKKIAKQYENDFIKINTFVDLPEPLSLSAAFRKKAGKATRLFLEESVSPVEMLVILGDTKKATSLYPIARPTVAQKERIEKIYSLQFDSDVTYQGNNVVFGKRALTNRQKQRILIAALSTFLCIAICVGTPFVVNAFVPFMGIGKTQEPDNTISETEEPGSQTGETTPSDPTTPTDPTDVDDKTEEPVEVTKFVTISRAEELDLSAADTRYTLANDIVLPDYSGSVVACQVDGAGHNVTVSAFPLFGNITGCVENIVFTVEGDRTVTESTAFFAKNNEGTVKNVSLTLGGTITVDTTPLEEGGETSIAGLFMENNGDVEDCSVTLDVVLRGSLSANAIFSGIVSFNKKNILSCSVTGSVVADTCDLAGICENNSYLIKETENSATLQQTSSLDAWNPIVSGFCINNYATLLSCANKGNVTVTATYESDDISANPSSARGAGMVISNTYSSSYGYIPTLTSCINEGNVTVSAKQKYVYAAGVALHSSFSGSGFSTYRASISSSENKGNIFVHSDKYSSYAAGISVSLSSTYFTVASCSNSGDITVETDKSVSTTPCEIVCGGIVAYTTSESQSSFFGTNNTSLSQCSNTGKIHSTLQSTPSSGFAMPIGGIVAYASNVLQFSACENKGEIVATYNGKDQLSEEVVSTSYMSVGGIVASASSSSIANCSNYANISALAENCSLSVGGIAGASSPSSSISSCQNEGNIEAKKNNYVTLIGGLIGNSGSVSHSINTGTVTIDNSAGKTFVGGCVGTTTNAVSRCVSYGDITVTGEADSVACVGGVCGQASYTVEYSYNEGSIVVTSGTAFVGGILGHSDHKLVSGWTGHTVYFGNVSNCITKGTITVTTTGSEASFVGGVCGYVEEKLYNEGTANETYFGGSVKSSFALGTVTATGTNVYNGSIVGASGKNITMKEDETHYEGNYYTSELNAIGAYVNGEEITEGDNLGGTRDLSSVITESETYKSIINVISALLGIESEPEQEEPTAPEPETPDPEEQEEPGSGNILT